VNFLRMASRLRRERFDLAVLLPNSFRAALLARMGGAKRVAGYDRDGRGWLLSDKLSPIREEGGKFKPVPTIDYYNALAGLVEAPTDSWEMALPVNPADEAAAEALLGEAGVSSDRPIVLLNPGASFGPSKLWPAERYASLADALMERDHAQIIINAAPNEKPIAAEVASRMKQTPAINFAERSNSLGLLKSLMKRSTLLVTNDTGARHFGAAMGIDLVTIFGSTDPVWAQIDYPRERILRADVPCGPCQQKNCPLPPGDSYHQCMKAISVEEVLSAAESLLGTRREARS
jgi:heptosyltransferase-2